jgi:hypothetical protein
MIFFLNFIELEVIEEVVFNLIYFFSTIYKSFGFNYFLLVVSQCHLINLFSRNV